MKRNIVILGSTGSIGKNALDVVSRLGRRFNVVGLAAHKNVEQMIDQIRQFSPSVVAMDDTPAAEDLKRHLRLNKKIQIWNHTQGIEKLAAHKNTDFVMCGMVGFRGLMPLVSALRAGKTIGLANKEALIVAGEIIMALSKKHNAPIIPVDSEHSAIFQCIQGQNHGDIKRIILTASGGPFYRYKRDLDKITVDQALRHPTWKMGSKITIDSATLMNKGLEAIEAHHLFQIPMNKISIVIHPQSIVHSLVEFEDGAILAQLSQPDMRLPIQYALTYPERLKTPVPYLDLKEIKRLEFDEPDFTRFPCLKLALRAGSRGGTAPVALSSSNEEAVHAFLEGRISFMTIANVVDHCVRNHPYKKNPHLNDVISVDAVSRQRAHQFISKLEKN